MAYSFHWRKAILASFFLHVFLVTVAGYLPIGLTVPLPPPEEIILEMDLINAPAQRAENNLTLLQSQNLQTTQNATPTAPLPLVETSSAEQETVVTTNDLTMTENEGTSAPNSPSASNSTSSGSGSSSPSSNTLGGGSGSPSGISAPGILSKTVPVYPLLARQNGLAGTVVLKVQILTNGRPGQIIVSRSTGHQTLDDAAVAAVEKWRFTPAKDRTTGKPVVCYTTLPVSFNFTKS